MSVLIDGFVNNLFEVHIYKPRERNKKMSLNFNENQQKKINKVSSHGPKILLYIILVISIV